NRSVDPMSRVPAILALLSVVWQPIPAQVLYGSLVGTVTGPTLGGVIGAKVSANDPATGLTRDTETDERGGYTLSQLPEGRYNLTVIALGFSAYRQTGVAILANAVVRADMQLSLAAVQESITVTADPTPLQTDRPDLQHSFSGHAI